MESLEHNYLLNAFRLDKKIEHMLDLIRSKSYFYNALWTWHLMINWLLCKTDFEFQKLTCHRMTELWHVSDLLLADSLLLSFTFLFQIIRAVGRSKNPRDIRIVDQTSDVPSIIFFFMISCKILCKSFQFFFSFL